MSDIVNEIASRHEEIDRNAAFGLFIARKYGTGRVSDMLKKELRDAFDAGWSAK